MGWDGIDAVVEGQTYASKLWRVDAGRITATKQETFPEYLQILFHLFFFKDFSLLRMLSLLPLFGDVSKVVFFLV